MTQVKFKGQLKKVDCQSPTTKLTIEVDTETTKLDEIKPLLDIGVDITLANNQSTFAEHGGGE